MGMEERQIDRYEKVDRQKSAIVAIVFGDLCADAYRMISGADIAVVNGGGIGRKWYVCVHIR